MRPDMADHRPEHGGQIALPAPECADRADGADRLLRAGVFLHEVLPGSADRSYGIQVAKLAGLPPAVITRAKSVLAKLEAQDRGQTARALADDLPLFAVPSRAAAEPAPPSEAEQLLEAAKALHPDEMSPREALEALYALKTKLPKG